MSRRNLPALFLILASLIARAGAADAKIPNILFVIADDWGAHASAYGTPWIKTPAFDRVAKEGLLFNRAFTPVAKCAPSRAIILTGRYAWQLEEAGNHVAYFPTKFRTWPEALRDAGWFVGLTGKGWAPGIAQDPSGQPRSLIGKPFDRRKAKPPTTGISNNDYAANFTDFLDAAPAGSPWCFWLGATEPHRRYEYGSGVAKGGKKLSDVDHVPAYWPDNETIRNDMLDYAYEVEHFDQHLGRVLAELEKRGLLENTIVIATSDHGMPFPRVKGFANYEANHVPLAIRWPKGIAKPGRVIDDYVSFTDLAPTLLDLAGIAEAKSGLATITGKSWREIFASSQSGRVVAARDHALIGKERTDPGRPGDVGYPIRGIVTDEWLFLHNYEPTRWPAGDPITGYLDTDGGPTKTYILAARRKNPADSYWPLNFGLRPERELYRLSGDRDELKNLATDSAYKPRLKELEQKMEAELKTQGDPRMFGKGDIFDSYPVATEVRDFYGRFMRGEKPKANWVEPGDFEPEPVKP